MRDRFNKLSDDIAAAVRAEQEENKREAEDAQAAQVKALFAGMTPALKKLLGIPALEELQVKRNEKYPSSIRAMGEVSDDFGGTYAEVICVDLKAASFKINFVSTRWKVEATSEQTWCGGYLQHEQEQVQRARVAWGDYVRKVEAAMKKALTAWEQQVSRVYKSDIAQYLSGVIVDESIPIELRFNALRNTFTRLLGTSILFDEQFAWARHYHDMKTMPSDAREVKALIQVSARAKYGEGDTRYWDLPLEEGAHAVVVSWVNLDEAHPFLPEDLTPFNGGDIPF